MIIVNNYAFTCQLTFELPNSTKKQIKWVKYASHTQCPIMMNNSYNTIQFIWT